jgi:hypothetical protein
MVLNPVKWEKVEVVITSIMEVEEILEAEVEETFEEEDVATSTNGETTISTITIHNIKEEVETISVLASVEEVEETIIKRGRIIIAFIVENLDIKQLIADIDNKPTWQKVHIKTLVRIMKIHTVYF